MKELSIEEKAAHYDKALEIARKINSGEGVAAPSNWTTCEVIFPELKESEDERIRKEIIQTLKRYTECVEEGHDAPSAKDFLIKNTEKLISWLEKQVEQKQDPCEHCEDKYLNCHNFPCITKREFEQGKSALEAIKEEKVDNANKVERGFKVGDWIIDNINKVIFLLKSFNSGYCTLEDTEGRIYSPCVPTNENDYHLWTIEDAKDGDVLYCKSSGIEYIVMSKGVNEHGNIDSYFRYNSLDGFGVDIPSVLSTIQDDITPATKEQHDLLFQKMREVGYVWDADKKELKKIENKKPLLSDFFKAEYERGKADAQKHTWSKEDEEKMVSIFLGIEAFCPSIIYGNGKEELLNWLKSIKDRYTWKPSDEQMEALKETVDEHFDIDGGALWHLYEDLKKLKR